MKAGHDTAQLASGSLWWFLTDRRRRFATPLDADSPLRQMEGQRMDWRTAWVLTRPGWWMSRASIGWGHRTSTEAPCGCRLRWVTHKPYAVTSSCDEHGLAALVRKHGGDWPPLNLPLEPNGRAEDL